MSNFWIDAYTRKLYFVYNLLRSANTKERKNKFCFYVQLFRMYIMYEYWFRFVVRAITPIYIEQPPKPFHSKTFSYINPSQTNRILYDREWLVIRISVLIQQHTHTNTSLNKHHPSFPFSAFHVVLWKYFKSMVSIIFRTINYKWLGTFFFPKLIMFTISYIPYIPPIFCEMVNFAKHSLNWYVLSICERKF